MTIHAFRNETHISIRNKVDQVRARGKSQHMNAVQPVSHGAAKRGRDDFKPLWSEKDQMNILNSLESRRGDKERF